MSSTSAFLLGVVEKQRLATAACRLERHAVRPIACRNIVIVFLTCKRGVGVGQVRLGRKGGRVAAVRPFIEG